MNFARISKNFRRDISPLALRGAISVVRITPLFLLEIIAELTATFLYIFLRKYRNKILNNLRCAYKDLGDAELRTLTKKIFRNIARWGFETIYFVSRKDLKGGADLVETIENENFLKQALDKEEGVIAVCAHLSNFPLLGIKLNYLNYPFAVIMRKARNPLIEKIFESYRKDFGQKTIPKTPYSASVKESISWLRRNGILGINIDQRSDSGAKVDFLGMPTFLATGAAYFAIKTKAVVLPMVIMQKPNKRYKIIIEEPIDVVRTGDLEKDLKENTQNFAQKIENYIRKFPQQWSWLHNFWVKK